MITTTQYSLTWEHFIKLHENKNVVFENLCRSLFLRKLCPEGTILHSDPEQPGVEVVPVLNKDGTDYISFQAKFFESKVGYIQIKRSTEQTVKYYAGNLNKLYLYCNKDIKSTGNSYEFIRRELYQVGIELILITGQAILDQVMEYPTLCSCYFGMDSLNDNWFEKNLQLSLDNLGKRYNPIFNINTSAQDNIFLFLRESNGIKAVNEKKSNFIKKIEEVRWQCLEKYSKYGNVLIKVIKSIADVEAKSIDEALKWKEEVQEKCKDVFEKLQNMKRIAYLKITANNQKQSECEELKREISAIDNLMLSLKLLEFSEQEKSCLKNKILIVTGEMGTGKSQLLASAAKRLNSNKRLVLLLLGQTYISNENIEKQIMNGLEGINDSENFESIIAVMNEKALIKGADSVVFIDAINESVNKNIWKIGLNRLIAVFEKYEHVRLVMSLRSGFENLLLSEKLLSAKKEGSVASIVHRGFVDDSFFGVYEFLAKSGIPFSPEYYLQEEMANPLFLTWFCQTYTGEEQGLITMINKILEQADKEGAVESGYDESIGMLKNLLYDIIDRNQEGITKLTILNSYVWSLYGVINKLVYIKAIERSGVLVSYVRDGEEYYYIGYNLLKDYLYASRIIDREKNKEKIKEYCSEQLLAIDEAGIIKNKENKTIFVMLSALYAVKFREECIDIVDKVEDDQEKIELVDQYLKTFTWRSSYIAYDYFWKIVNKYKISLEKIWNVFIENAIKENSELNVRGLTKILQTYELNCRDLVWTIKINELTDKDRIVSVIYFIEEGNAFEGLSNKKAFFLLILFGWFLSSSNRTLRDHVSKAMIEILKDRFFLCKYVLEEFKDVNDPYIVQRLYGIVFGAVMRRNVQYKEEFYELTLWIYNQIFMKKNIYPDILLRDYARLIIERFIFEYDTESYLIDLQKIRPPYRSDGIPEIKRNAYGDDKYELSGISMILASLRIYINEKRPIFYGDFGRDTLLEASCKFENVDVETIRDYAVEYILTELGYKNEYFGEYDCQIIDFDRCYVKKIERIGKKYQWIATYNILARLSDKYKLKRSSKEELEYNGPWELCVRDFDPTLNMRYKLDITIPRLKKQYGKYNFRQRLVQKDECDEEWVTLYLNRKKENSETRCNLSTNSLLNEEKSVKIVAISYIIMGENINVTPQRLETVHFISNNSLTIKECRKLFNREYAWSSGYRAIFENNENDNNEDEFAYAKSSVINAIWSVECDASQDEEVSLLIPNGDIIHKMKLYEKNVEGVYYYKNEIVAFDLKVRGYYHQEFVIRRDVLDEYLERNNAKLFWAVIEEKQFFKDCSKYNWSEGYFVYGQNKLEGDMYTVGEGEAKKWETHKNMKLELAVLETDQSTVSEE